MEILYTSGDVHKAIKEIFSLPCKRRVAVVAYLGSSAENYLPDPNGIEIICCPEPGATCPKAVRKLLSRGARIMFSAGLHSKVYWSDKGCIITSANISHRALGNFPQKEVGVLFDSKDIDIDRVIKESLPSEITQVLMDKLEIEDRRIRRVFGKDHEKRKIEFAEWYKSEFKEPWKIGWWSASSPHASRAANDKSKKEYNISGPEDFLNVTNKQVSSNEWLLCFETGNVIKNIEWMYVDFVVKVEADDKNAFDKDYPCQAIQVHKLSKYPEPPFFLSPQFKKALKQAVQEYNVSKEIEASKKLMPSKKLLDLIHNKLSDNT